jgi:hypothetical protein
VKSGEKGHESPSVWWTTHVALPSKDYADYLRSSGRQNDFSGWDQNQRTGFYFRNDGEYWFYINRQPDGWLVERQDCAQKFPIETLCTILDSVPVVFPTLRLAAQVAQDSELVLSAQLHWTAGRAEAEALDQRLAAIEEQLKE